MDLVSEDASYWGAILAFDDKALEHNVTRRARTPDTAELVGGMADAWLALMQGRAPLVESSMAGLFARAAASQVPCHVIETTVLRAMVAQACDKLADALAVARRASLMARTEALPGAHLLANIVLSRMRRHAGKPYLAVRILDALTRVGTAQATGWLNWEHFLAAGTPLGAAIDDGTTPASRALAAGQRLLLAARAGQRGDFERSGAELVQAAAGFAVMRDEARALVAMLDPDHPFAGSLLEFKRGNSDQLAYGLVGAKVLCGEEESGSSILVVARPGQPGARILRDGLGLFGPCQMLSQGDGARRAHGRTDTGLAVLALAGAEPLPEGEFFAKVYGFAYKQARHRGVLDVLLHRMRKRIAAGGSLLRSARGLHLELQQPIAVMDPRCSPPAAARILSALARQPTATADAIAGRLGITLRAAQIALQQLVSDGACVMRKRGRQIEYQLQDSTFSEPTGMGFIARETRA
jgi:hypothetical protein